MTTQTPPPAVSPDRADREGDPSASPWNARLLCLAGAVLAAVIQIGPQWRQRSEVGPDECYMLQAAVRASRGEGLTSSMYDRLQDLAEPVYGHIRQWPPLWCFTVIGLTRAGCDEDFAPVIIQTIAGLAGAYGWMRLGAQVLPVVPAVVFAIGVASVWFGSALGPGDLPVWGLVPWFAGQLLRGRQTGRLRHFALAGGVAALAVGFRYAAVFLAPAGAIAALLIPASAGVRVLRAAAVALPSVAAMGAIFAFNAANSGAASWVSQKGWAWSPENLLSVEPIKFLFVQGFGFESAFYRHWPHLAREPWLVWPGWYALMAAALAGAWWRRRSLALPLAKEESAGVAPFLTLCGAMTICLLGLLGGLTLFMPAKQVTPLGEPRYYRELMPAVALAWVALLWPACADGAGRLRRGEAGVAMAAVCAALAILAGLHLFRSSVSACRRLATPADESAPAARLDRLVRSLAARAAPHPHRVFDLIAALPERLLRVDDVKAFRMPQPPWLEASSCSRRTYLIVIDRTPADPAPDVNVNPASLFVRRFGLKPVAPAGEYGDCVVYAGWVEPYPAPAPAR